MDPQYNSSNTNQNPTPSPINTPSPVVSNSAGNKKVGPIIAIFIIVVVIVALAIYMFASKSNNQPQSPSDLTSTASGLNADGTPVQQTVQPITNTSDDVQSLQNDLNASTKGVDSQNF